MNLDMHSHRGRWERGKGKQYNRTDPDATLMSKPAYNSLIAVNGKYKFIVATDVTSEGRHS